MSTIICAPIASRVISVRTMVSGLMRWRRGGACLVSLLFGQFSYDPFDGNTAFVGAFGSKNQLGLYASLGAYTGLVGLFAMRLRIAWRVWSGISAAFALFCLSASQSAASAITLVVAIAAVFAAVFLRRFAPRHRTVFFLVWSAGDRGDFNRHKRWPVQRPSQHYRQGCHFDGPHLSVAARSLRLRRKTQFWAKVFKLFGCKASRGQKFSGTSSTFRLAWASISLTPISKRWWSFGYVGLLPLSVVIISLLAATTETAFGGRLVSGKTWLCSDLRSCSSAGPLSKSTFSISTRSARSSFITPLA